MKLASIMIALGLFSAPTAWSQPASAIVPVRTGVYAPADAGCDIAAAALISIHENGIGANKVDGKVLSIQHTGRSYSLDVLWVEVGADEVDGERDLVEIEVVDERSFFFSNTLSERTLMRWCS